MADPLDDIVRLVAEGRLSPEEAAPIIDALAAAGSAAAEARRTGAAARETARGIRSGGTRSSGENAGPPRRLRVQVRENGRTVVDLQLPGVLAELAGAVPGIPSAYAERVREALRAGLRGPIVDVIDEDGSGVTITID